MPDLGPQHTPVLPMEQTTFGYGRDHFSQTHADHSFGSTAPVQHDFGLNMSNGRFKPLVGVDSDECVQTTLRQFKY